jgi:type II secretory pathway predicted ATPase ExeA
VTHALITEAALRQVFRQSHGLPRSVNRLILRTLDLAYCHQRQIVDEEMVELALAE